MVDKICQDTLITHTLKDSATLEISGNCYLKTRDLTIRTNNEKTTYIHNAFIPPLNISNILTNHTSKTTNKTDKATFIKFSSQDELKLVSESINLLKNGLDNHNLHHYSLIYLLFILVIALLCYRRYKTYKIKPKSEPKTEKPNQQKDTVQTVQPIQSHSKTNEKPSFMLDCSADELGKLSCTKSLA